MSSVIRKKRRLDYPDQVQWILQKLNANAVFEKKGKCPGRYEVEDIFLRII
jgi:hypothetical protein